MRILVLALDTNDMIEFWERHPEIQDHQVMFMSPGRIHQALAVGLTQPYDRLKVSAAIWLHPLGDTYVKSALPVIRKQVAA